MKWPKKVKHRKKVLAKIYRPCAGRGSYRVAWTVSGKRMMKSFPTYGGQGGALEYAEELVKDLAKGSQVTALTPEQAGDALTAFDRLQRFYQETGVRLSLREAVSECCEARGKLGKHTLAEAIDGFLTTVATINRTDMSQAVEEFVEGRKAKTIAKEGKRPQLSPGYHYNVSMWLREFAGTFRNSAVCDLTTELLDTYMAKHGDVSPKTRNERRGTVKMFLKWCVKKKYLSAAHGLLDAEGMTKESYEPEDIECYTANELRAMLERASKRPGPPEEGQQPGADYTRLVPMIAMVALGGVRLQEASRLTWADVWHVEGHVEVSVAKSKTRSRRLVTVCPALAGWLEPYRNSTGPLWPSLYRQHWHKAFEAMLAELNIPVRRNGLRHSFVSAHYALHADEGLTAKEAGNSPAMVHSNYKGLMTKADGVAWFAVAPAQAANVIPLTAKAVAQDAK